MTDASVNAGPPRYMTLQEFLLEFSVARSTFTRWVREGKPIPDFRRMHNGQLRALRADVYAWFEALPEVAA